MSLYDEIKNPLDDELTMNNILEAYSRQNENVGRFYGEITEFYKKDSKSYYVPYYNDIFYSRAFNLWKKNMLSMTKERAFELRDNGYLKAQFVYLIKFLRGIDDVSTEKEVNDIINSVAEDPNLSYAFEKYYWNIQDFGWTHVKSRYMNGEWDHKQAVEHRLYLNPDSKDTVKMLIFLMQKFLKNDMPYYFKFDRGGTRDDTIIIYSSTEMLEKYISILREIKEEHPELMKDMFSPSLLTGKIDGWIGYGSEPSKDENGKVRSFNQVRVEAMDEVITEESRNWALSHKDMKVKYKNKPTTFEDYLAQKTVEVIKQRLIKWYNGFIPEAAFKQCGYDIETIESEAFTNNIYRLVTSNMHQFWNSVCIDKSNPESEIQINVKNGRKINITSEDFSNAIKKVVPIIAKIDPNFKKRIKSEIIRVSKDKYGIDPNNYCFDILATQKVKKLERDKKEAEQEALKKNESLSKVKKEELPSIISSFYTNREVILPNGNLMFADEYLEDMVFPYLPQNGVVILSDGNSVPVKQFVERYIMDECQYQYNSDIRRYMMEKTRNNFGVIKLESNGVTCEFPTSEITNIINPELLRKKLKLSDGKILSAQVYIDEIYEPHIPYNGIVTLKDGREISVKRYIEDVLIKDFDKYNGDLARILEKTTINNNGTINMDINIYEKEKNV